MNAVAQLSDPFPRLALTVLRATGLQVGELLDLELGSVIDYGPTGTWLRVPIGKFATERMVPLNAAAIAGAPAGAVLGICGIALGYAVSIVKEKVDPIKWKSKGIRLRRSTRAERAPVGLS
jgi:hypothetical protein